MMALSQVVWAMLLLCGMSFASIVQSFSCNLENELDYKLAPFILDVILDEDTGNLLFYMTSKVVNFASVLDRLVMINDVNQTTNRWTNLNVQVSFLDDMFVNENVRFCEVVSVKNSTEFYSSPRFLDSGGGGGGSGNNNNNPLVGQGGVGSVVNGTFTNINQRSDASSDSCPDSDDIAATFVTPDYSVFNATNHEYHCPLYVNDTIILYYETNIGKNLRKLGSYTAVFTLVSNDANSTIISCNKMYITAAQPGYINKAILIGVLVFLLITGCINFFTVIYSSYQESSNPLLYTASTICNESLLKQLNCTCHEIMLYLQFALFIGALDLQYPGFYQPILADLKWSSLLGISVKAVQNYSNVDHDHVYGTFYRNGLQVLTTFSTELAMINMWPNFMIVLAIWIVIQIMLKQSFIYLKEFVTFIRGNKYMVSEHGGRLSLEKNLSLVLGDIMINFLDLFAFPFLTLTLYLFSTAANTGAKGSYWLLLSALKKEMFDFNTSYNQLFYEHLTYPYTNNYTLPLNETNEPSESKSGMSFTNITGFGSMGAKVKFQMPILHTIPGAILFALWIGLVFYFIFHFLLKFQKKWRRPITTNPNVSKLYTSLKTILIWGSIYNHFEPSKVYFAIFGYISVFTKLIIISTIQSNGLVQVVLLSVVGIIECCLFAYVRPYYIKTPWYSTRSILPFARLIITFLCIPFIRDLEVSELQRTYVAYAQFSIHMLVALVFFVQLIYGFITTLISIYKKNRNEEGESKHVEAQPKKETNVKFTNSIEAFNKEFEYRPIHNIVSLDKRSKQAVDDVELYDFYYRGGRGNAIEEKNVNFDDDLDYNFNFEDEVEDESENPFDTSGSAPPARALLTESPDSGDDDHLISSSSSVAISDRLTSFHEQQKTSDRRKETNDYTFREGDLIYKKYIVDESIDPEIKALWNSRNERLKQSVPLSPKPRLNDNKLTLDRRQHPSKSSTSSNFISRLLKGKEPTENKGFEVMRPRPLIVKTKEQLQEHNSNNEYVPDDVPDEVLSLNSPIAAEGTSKSVISLISPIADDEGSHKSDSWLFIPQQI